MESTAVEITHNLNFINIPEPIEKAPKDGTRVLGYDPDDIDSTSVIYWNGNGWRMAVHDHRDACVLWDCPFFISLPQPPKE